jgi:hypothetical protein
MLSLMRGAEAIQHLAPGMTAALLCQVVIMSFVFGHHCHWRGVGLVLLNPNELTRTDKIIPRTEPLFEQQMLQCRYPGSHFRHPDVNLFDQIIHEAPKLRIPVLPGVSRLFLTTVAGLGDNFFFRGMAYFTPPIMIVQSSLPGM